MDRFIKYLMRTRSLLALVILFLVAAFIMQIRQAAYVVQQTQESQTAQIDEAVTPKVVPKFDLHGTYVCQYASSSAVFSNKNFAKEDKTASGSSFMVFKDDCIYTWNSWSRLKNKKYNGQMICGFGQYVSMLDIASKTGAVTMDTILSYATNNNIVPGMSKIAGSASTKKLVDSCKSAKNIPPEVFTLPKDVVFKK